ncbi:MAG: hypothetical protein ACREDL_15940, partial [Bradyrhizobium sp.]
AIALYRWLEHHGRLAGDGDVWSVNLQQNLTPTHLENLKMRGDAYMRELVEGIQRGGVTHDYDYSRSREI